MAARNRAISGHVLPVTFRWHLGIALDELASSGLGFLGRDPRPIGATAPGSA